MKSVKYVQPFVIVEFVLNFVMVEMRSLNQHMRRHATMHTRILN